jgi:hypothetical protein
MFKKIILILILSILIQGHLFSEDKNNYIDSIKSLNNRINILEDKAKENHTKFDSMLTISQNTIDLLNKQNEKIVSLFFIINGLLVIIVTILGVFFTITRFKLINAKKEYIKIKIEIEKGLNIIEDHKKELIEQNKAYILMADSNQKLQTKYNNLDEKIEKIEVEINNIKENENFKLFPKKYIQEDDISIEPEKPNIKEK